MIPELPRIQKGEKWHKRRQRGIGGSDWVSILSDQHPDEYKYGCIRRLYYLKRGYEPDFPPEKTKAAMRGNILEPVVAELFKAHTGCRYSRRRPKVKYILSRKRPEWWIGNPDFLPEFPPDWHMEVLECKTMNINVWLKFIEEGLSVGYKLQPQHYMGLTGLDVANVAVMWPDGLDFQVEVVPRDDNILQLMLTAGDWFMEGVLPLETPPDRPPITEERCGGCVYGERCLGKKYFELHDSEFGDLSSDSELYNILRKIRDAQDEETAAKNRIKVMKQEAAKYLMSKYDESEKFFCRELEVSHVKGEGSRFSKNDLLADRPDLTKIIAEYTKRFPQRTLSVKVTKKSTSRWSKVTGEE